MDAGSRRIGGLPYIAFLGDSMTFANGIDYEQSFTGIFRKLANADGIEVVNLGVRGQSFQDQVEVFREFIDAVPQSPELVVLCFLPFAIDGLDLRDTNIIVKNGYLFHLGNWIAPYLRVFLGNTSEVFCFFRDSFRRIRAMLIHDAFKNSWMHMHCYRKDNRIANSSVSEEFDLVLRKLDTLLASKQTTTVYVYLPASPDLKLDDFFVQTGESPADNDFNLLVYFLSKHCSLNDLELINLSPVLKEHHLKGTVPSFPLDSHDSQEANQFIEEALCNAIIDESGRPRGKQESSRARTELLL